MVPNTGMSSGFVPNASRLRWYCLRDVAQRVLAPLAVELVDGDDVGEVEHVDLLELAGGAELGRHHVERDVDEAARSRRRPGRCRGSRR
jgi:hypothetical protein